MLKYSKNKKDIYMKLILEDMNEITVLKIKEETEESFKTYYLSKNNKEDDLTKATKALEKSDRSVHLKKIKYAIDDNDYIYSLRVI